MRMHCYVISVKMGLFWKINTTALILKISLPNLQGTLDEYAFLQRPDLCEKNVDFISKTGVPVYFEQACITTYFFTCHFLSLSYVVMICQEVKSAMSNSPS